MSLRITAWRGIFDASHKDRKAGVGAVYTTFFFILFLFLQSSGASWNIYGEKRKTCCHNMLRNMLIIVSHGSQNLRVWCEHNVLHHDLNSSVFHKTLPLPIQKLHKTVSCFPPLGIHIIPSGTRKASHQVEGFQFCSTSMYPVSKKHGVFGNKDLPFTSWSNQ